MSISDQVPLEKLPLQDLLGFLEINPPRLPYNSLVGSPTGVPFSILEDLTLANTVTGFQASLGPQLAQKNYAHLMGICSILSGGAVTDAFLTFNADVGASYRWQQSGSGGSANNGASLANGIKLPAAAADNATGIPGVAWFLVPNFFVSGKAKACAGVSGAFGASIGVYVFGGSWVGTSPITQVGVSCTANLAAGSRFTFYALGSQ